MKVIDLAKLEAVEGVIGTWPKSRLITYRDGMTELVQDPKACARYARRVRASNAIIYKLAKLLLAQVQAELERRD